ncbi:MAG: ArsR/SmtB family transcription factor [Myxococcota bacterium]
MIDRHAAESLADLLGALGHPDRLRLLLALREGEHDVATLARQASLSQPRTSQHLALLRAHHLVAAKKQGRRSMYSLMQPELLPWLAQAASFLEADAQRSAGLAERLTEALMAVRPPDLDGVSG